MTVVANPFRYTADDGGPLVELKHGLTIYLDQPRSVDQARALYQHYLANCGERIRFVRSTAPAMPEEAWNTWSRHDFETKKLPNLYSAQHWGYLFHDGHDFDSWLFMFHGHRRHTEAQKASVVRYDFDWQVDPLFIRRFAQEVIGLVPCLSGFAGYYFQGRLAYNISSFNLVYALSRRYWGIEANNIDVTVNHARDGYKCVNWLTIIGDKFRRLYPQAVDEARKAAFDSVDTVHATLLQAQAAPEFGDRNRREWLSAYARVAEALLPIQLEHHGPFGGSLWDEDSTMRYLRRFTHPNDV